MPEADRSNYRVGREADLALAIRIDQGSAMAKLLSTVADVFQLSGRASVVVAPGIPREGGSHLRVGDKLHLKRPDGSELETTLGGIEMLSPPHPTDIPIMLGPGLTKEAVPIGTEIWVGNGHA